MLTAHIMKHQFDDYRVFFCSTTYKTAENQMSKGFMGSSKAKFQLLKLKSYKNKNMLMGQICPDKEGEYTIQATPITAKSTNL